MIKRIEKMLKKLNNNFNFLYLKYSRLEIDENVVLLEGGQGSNINGNMFSMLREINTNVRFSNYKTVFVVTQKNLDSARERIKFYGFDRVILTVRNSNDYCKYLATAKYLMTDNSFPPYFNKRSGQIFLNTWHGTPLKTLGKSDKSNLASLANIQKNYLMSDYALFPNAFTKDVFMKDYDLEHIFTGKSLIANYPRNYVFYDAEQGRSMKKSLGYEDKQLIAYMPTWRGTGRTADTEAQLHETMGILKEFDAKLRDNQVLLVNLHFLLASQIDCSAFKHINAFSADYDTYEILNACDTLITDYSSVFFDFAVTEKQIILFAYDKEKYLDTRGVYIDFESLPFAITRTVDETVKQLDESYTASRKFIDTYCTNGSSNSCENLFDMMITGSADIYELDENKSANKDICLIYAGTLPEVYFDSIKSYIAKSPNYNYVLAYRHNFTPENKAFVLSLDADNISTLGLISAFQFSAREVLSFIAHRKLGIIKDNKCLKAFFAREKQRLFYGIHPSKVVDLSCGNLAVAGILSRFDCEKENVTHGDFFCSSKKFLSLENFVKKYESAKGFNTCDMSAQENADYLKQDNELADESFRKNSVMKNLLPLYIKDRNKMKCISMFTFNTPIPTRLADTYITVGERVYKPKFYASKSRLKKRHIGIYSFSIPVEDVVDMPATNMVALCYKNHYDKLVQCHIIYCALFYRFFFGLRGPILKEKETDTVAVFRQSKNNRLNVYVRSWIKSDSLLERFKQDLAFIVSQFWHTKKAKKLVLLYEKNSSKYEESASVTFEKLIDKGYRYAYFIVDRDYEYIDRIPEQYRKNILYKHTFKHYLYFFRAKTFIGTEALVHAIDLKTFNVCALKKISDKDINYVFLQHGVMYMVSLDSEARSMFKRKNLDKKYRVVVSSRAEADHFTQLGRHLPQDLYITGLPKFDRNELLPDADKIVIMPTWRPWEINLARDDFSQTAYFKMVMKIYNSVPDELKDKVIILPHPLIVNELHHLERELVDKMVIDARYDDILKQTRVLITDYSSIAYDAFYRGSRVIFYWEERDYCLSQYGPSTKLMLNEDNVYGDFFYSDEGLTESIRYNYNTEQSEEYIKRYSHIVQFKDGRNTDRLINYLIDDGIIEL